MRLNFLKLIAVVIMLLTLLNPVSLFAQGKGSLHGKVVANKNQAADNVSIGLMGTSFGTTTNNDGEFNFRGFHIFLVFNDCLNSSGFNFLW